MLKRCSVYCTAIEVSSVRFLSCLSRLNRTKTSVGLETQITMGTKKLGENSSANRAIAREAAKAIVFSVHKVLRHGTTNHGLTITPGTAPVQTDSLRVGSSRKLRR